MKKIGLVFLIICSISLLLISCSQEKKELKTKEKGGVPLEKIAGTWEGSIQIPNQPLPIIVQFSNKSGTISIPAQGVQNYPLTEVNLEAEGITFTMDIQKQHIAFYGKVGDEKITGTFKQNGQSFPFELMKEEDVAAEDSGDNVQIERQEGLMYGQLELPSGEGPFPVMIILAGSGPTDKDGNSTLLPGKNNSLKMLAEDLAAKGIASIRYDKRGIGKNLSLGGNEEDLRFEHYIDDAAAWVQFAKEDKRFSKVGVIGHSEGSLIGMVAAQKAEADVFVSIAGAGRPIDEVLTEQLAGQLPANLQKESAEILEKLKKGERVKEVSAELQSLYRSSVQPYMISWLQYNPQKEIEKLDCPVLIINGSHDIQVPVSDAERLHEAKEASSLYIVEGMNHILKEAPEEREGNIATYTNPDLPLAEGLISHIIEFMKNNGILDK